MNRKKTHLIVPYFSFIISGDWRKIQKKHGKTAQKNIAYSRAITYIPKTDDFRLQTVMLPIGCFWKLLRRLTSVIRGRPNKSKIGYIFQNLY